MSFEDLKINMANVAFDRFGVDAFHRSKSTGTVLKARVILKRNFESNPGALLTGISEKITVIDFKYSDVSDPRPGDTVTILNETFTIDNELENDNLKVRVSVKNG